MVLTQGEISLNTGWERLDLLEHRITTRLNAIEQRMNGVDAELARISQVLRNLGERLAQREHGSESSIMIPRHMYQLTLLLSKTR